MKFFESVKLALLIFATATTISCRKEGIETVSEEASLDEVLGVSDANPRYCGAAALPESEKTAYIQKINGYLKDRNGQDTELFITGGSQELRRFTAETLVAIPDAMSIQVFNDNVQGQIVLSNEKVRSVCQSLSDSQEPVYGCAQKLPGENLKIYLRERQSVIGVKLVQLFAQTMSRNLSSVNRGFSLVDDDSDIAAKFKAQINEFVQMRQQLLLAFESDIANLDSSSALAFKTLQADEKLHYVFGHTADSVYCSEESMAKFEAMAKNGQFQNTFKSFFGLGSSAKKSIPKILGNPWFHQTP